MMLRISAALLLLLASSEAFTSPTAFRPALVARMSETSETESAFVPPPPAEDDDDDEDVPLEAVEMLGRGSAKVSKNSFVVGRTPSVGTQDGRLTLAPLRTPFIDRPSEASAKDLLSQHLRHQRSNWTQKKSFTKVHQPLQRPLLQH